MHSIQLTDLEMAFGLGPQKAGKSLPAMVSRFWPKREATASVVSANVSRMTCRLP